MGPINAVLRSVFDLVVLPFRGMPAIIGLTVISIVVSAAVLVAFGRLSDQGALEAVKRRIHAGIYEIRLFKDDLRTIFSAQLGVARETWTYFKLSLAPMLWIIVPIVIVVIQLQFQYGYEPLEPGESTLVRVELTEEGAERVATTDAADVSLEAPNGIRVETPLVWVPTLREAGWRIAAEEPGEYDLVVRIGDESVTKTLRAGGTTELRSPVKPSSFWEQIIWPAESPVPDGSSVEAIYVDYVDGEINMFGWNTHWLIAFFILTMVFAFALAKPMGVKI